MQKEEAEQSHRAKHRGGTPGVLNAKRWCRVLGWCRVGAGLVLVCVLGVVLAARSRTLQGRH